MEKKTVFKLNNIYIKSFILHLIRKFLFKANFKEKKKKKMQLRNLKS